jgi:hypothetical protein
VNLIFVRNESKSFKDFQCQIALRKILARVRLVPSRIVWLLTATRSRPVKKFFNECRIAANSGKYFGKTKFLNTQFRNVQVYGFINLLIGYYCD